jgi:hypothetical protein
LDCELDLTRPYSHLLQTIHASAGSEWHPWLTAVTQPALINQYQREYYATPDGLIRATLDYNQVFFNQRFATRPNIHRPSPLSPLTVIEVKAPPEQSAQLESVMSRFPLPRSRHSKYINGVMAG